MNRINKNLLKSTACAVLLGAGFMTTAQAAVTTETRSVGAFDAIQSNGRVDVEVKVGSAQSVQVVIEEDLQELVLTEVDGGVLEISHPRGSNREFRRYDRDMKVIITVPELHAFSLNGSGDAAIEDISSDEFTLRIRGSGDSVLTGSCQRFEIGVMGSGDVDARGFNCDDNEISVRGSGDVRMNVNGAVDAQIMGSGDVELRGTCTKAEFNIRGSGDIDARDLTCSEADVESRGSGDIELTVNGDVRLNLNGSGSVDLWGDPAIRQVRMRGSGNFEIHN